MSDVLTPRTHGRFLKALTTNRNDIETLSFADAVKKAGQKGGTTLFEVLKDGELYIVFTDCDHYCETLEPPSKADSDHVFDRMCSNLNRLLEEVDCEPDVILAKRHGIDPKKQVFKLSFRCYLLGLVSTLADMRGLIVKKGLHQAGVGSLDVAPYNKNQLLGCVGFYKSEVDRRVLVPVLEATPLESFMVQNVTGNEVILKYTKDDDNETVTQNDDGDSEDTFDFQSSRFAPPWDILERLVKSLNVETRCEKGSYNDWTRVGWAIAGVARAAKRVDDGLCLWLDFCRQCPKAYNENPLKAWQVYRGANSRGEHLGWKSLMGWLKVDNVDVYEQIREELSRLRNDSVPIEDAADLKVLKKFVKTRFHHQVKHIKKIMVVTYNSGKFIIADTDETTCPIIDDDHGDDQAFTPFIVVGLKAARDKCRHEDCRDKSSIVVDAKEYPGDVTAVVDKYLKVEITPQNAIQNFVLERKEKELSGMDSHDIQPAEAMPYAERYVLPKNRFCYIHNCCHDNPENCIIVDRAAKSMVIGCRLDPYRFHPPGGIAIPQNVTNIVIQNAHFAAPGSDNELILSSDYSGDELPFYKNDAAKQDKFIKSFTGEHNDVAWFVHALWGAEFRYFDYKWHCFENHIWTPIKDVPLLRSRLSTELCDLYVRVQQFYRNNMELDRAKEKIDQLKKTISGLKNAHFKESVMKEVVEVFQIENRDFARQINLSDLLPFTNGVLELDTYKFRPGRPDDKMTLSTKIEFIPYDSENPTTKKVEAFVESILPDEAVRSYLLKLSAICLTRDTRHQAFHILTGFGSNGKSIYLDLLARTLGEFAATSRVTVLTESSGGANGAQEAISKLEFKRLVTFNEPPKQSMIQAEVIKQFAGGTDKISTRGLQKSEREFIPEFKPILACNWIPKISEDSHAVWRRVRIIDFPMKFCDDPDPDDPLQGLADNNLANETKIWGPFLAGYLVEWLKRMREEGMTAPAGVLKRTNEYKDDNDPYREFMDGFIEPEEDPDKPLQWQYLREVFRTWYNLNNSIKLGQRAGDVKDYFNSRLGGYQNTTRKNIPVRGYLNWRLIPASVAQLKARHIQRHGSVPFLPDPAGQPGTAD